MSILEYWINFFTFRSLRNWWKARKRRKHCNHFRQRGIYGDEIIFGSRGMRGQCIDCKTFLNELPKWDIPRCDHGHIILGRPDPGCVMQNAYIEKMNANMRTWEDATWFRPVPNE